MNTMAWTLRAARMFSLPLIALVACGGCGDETDVVPAEPVSQSVASVPTAPVRAEVKPPAPADGSGEVVEPTNAKEIMVRLGKGPNALTPSIGKELKQESPPWETIRPQASEYARLTARLDQYEPPKGSQESWKALTAAFAQSADELDKAVQAGDKEAAVAIHGELAGSCMSCHQEHRVRGRGPGGGGPGVGGPGGPRGFPN